GGMARYLHRNATDEQYRALDALARRLPEKAASADAVGIDPEPVPLDRGAVAATMIHSLGDRPLEPLLEFLPSMDPHTRSALARKAAERQRLNGDLRRTIVKMVGDRSPLVRQNAVVAMHELTPNPDETLEIEALLTRKAGDLRRGVVGLLSRLPSHEVVESARRLWAGTDAQRDAACELLSVVERNDAVVATAQSFVRDQPSTTQGDVLAAILDGGPADPDDRTLGLYEAEQLSSPPAPRARTAGRRFTDDSSFRIAEALDDLAETHRNTPLEFVSWQGSTEMLLADAYRLPSPFRPPPPASEAGGWGMVLPEVFR